MAVFETYYSILGSSNCVLKRMNYIPKAKELKHNKTFIYKKITYKENGKDKTAFLSLQQLNELNKSKTPDMEMFVEGEKRYISSVLLDIYLSQNQNIVCFE